MADIAGTADTSSSSARIYHAHSLAPVRIELTKLRFARTFLERWPVCEIHPSNSWKQDFYISNSPATFILRDVIVYSRSGLLFIENSVIDETITFSDPNADNYSNSPDGITIHPSRITQLPGIHITTLYGISHNYYHAIVDGIARLSMAPLSLLDKVESIFYSGASQQSFLLEQNATVAKIARRPVSAGEAFHVEALVFPLSLHHNGAFHPCLSEFFDSVSATVPDDAQTFPRRFYVDRRGSIARRLLNESEVVERLQPLGFVPVRLEDLSFSQQIRLFRSAEAIVSPHGAALANLGWCRHGCVILELHMDAYAHWFYRNLAGLRSLNYDCIFGRTIDPWPLDTGRTQGLRWMISADHVVAGAYQLLENLV